MGNRGAAITLGGPIVITGGRRYYGLDLTDIGISLGRRNRRLPGGLPHSWLMGGSRAADGFKPGPLYRAVEGRIADYIHSSG